MLKNVDIVCLSSIDWDFIWQGHQEIMQRLARAGNRVLFIENTGARSMRLRDLPRIRQRWRNWRRSVQGIRQIERGLYVYSPLVLPFPYSRVIQWINQQLVGFAMRRWMQAVGFKRPIAWVFLPTPLTLHLLRVLNPELTVYYCIDNFAASSTAAQKIRRAEQQVIRQADLVFVTSQALRSYCAQWNPRVHDFPFGVNLELFEQAAGAPPDVPADLAQLPSPRVGYVGGIHQWVDQALVRQAALEHPECSFVLVGPVQVDVAQLQGLANVHLLGAKPHHELPRYIRAFDVCLIPYQLTEYTRHVYPTKLNEYFALGKPVVSTALPEVEAVAKAADGSVLIGRHPGEFNERIIQGLDRADGRWAAQRREIAAGNAWGRKVAQMSELIERALIAQRLEQELHWTERLLALTRGALRRLVSAAVIVAVLYVVMFRTPLLWWVASPLKISQPPVAADAIVVFAGGVGESGEAGQGYAERLKRAVELYRAGYGPTLILSSGFTFALKEAEVMRALAISLGVPPQAIILDTESRNTHENIRNTAAILRTRGAHRALLVSSPYHMRRALLTAKKSAPDLTYIPTPPAKSDFFGDQRRVTWQHGHAILHEYAAVLYYWLRGWL